MTNTTDAGYQSSVARIKEDDLKKLKADMKRNPEDHGFEKMFAHSPPLRVVEISEK